MERYINGERGFVQWDDVYLKKGWWFQEGRYLRDRRWAKSPLNPINHDCWLNAEIVVLSGATCSREFPFITDDIRESYYMCRICGRRLTPSENDKRKEENRINSR